MTTILTVAITLIAGAAVFSFVNSQATVSENQYGQAVGGTVDSIRERYVVMDMDFSQTCSTTCSVTIWLYNAGQVNLQIAEVKLYDSSGALNIVYTNNPSATPTCTQVQALDQASGGYEHPALNAISVAPGVLQPITLFLPCAPPIGTQALNVGTAYSVNILSTGGNSVIYYQEK